MIHEKVILNMFVNQKVVTKVFAGLVVAHISTDNFLGILAFVLGPALAAGHNLVIHAETRLSFVIFLLIELSVKAG